MRYALEPVRDFSATPTLSNRAAVLEQLGHHHLDDLIRAATVGELWRRWYVTVPAPEAMVEAVDRRLAEQRDGLSAPWAILIPTTGQAVGMTSFHSFDPANKRLELGRTWFAADLHGSGINAAVKILQLARAFEVLDVHAVELRANWHNHRSRQAIERLGAKQDGVLRKHRIQPDGTVRDTVVYSITDDEWPAVKLALTDRLHHRYGPGVLEPTVWPRRADEGRGMFTEGS